MRFPNIRAAMEQDFEKLRRFTYCPRRRGRHKSGKTDSFKARLP
jgi:hypothetical protein